MTRYDKIAYAVNVYERLFCKMYFIKKVDREIDGKDLYDLRRSLLNHIIGNYKYDLIDLSDDGLDQFIEYVQKKITEDK